jgi:hypothetical protein
LNSYFFNIYWKRPPKFCCYTFWQHFAAILDST